MPDNSLKQQNNFSMSLQDYIDAIINCPDELVKIKSRDDTTREVSRLTADYGIFDNWPILFSGNYDKFIGDMLNSEGGFAEKYKFFCQWPQKKDRPEVIIKEIDFAPGIMILQARNYVSDAYTSFNSPEESKKQLEKYDFVIMIHPYQNQRDASKPLKLNSPLWERAAANLIVDIARYAQTSKVPLCFPRATGWKDFTQERIIYFDP